MSNQALPPLPHSPGVGARRKGPRVFPTLPLSAFTPPNTGTSEQFPLAASPNTIHPSKVIDAQVITPAGDLSKWKEETAIALEGKAAGVVISLTGDDIQKSISTLSSSQSTPPIIAFLVPFNLEQGVPASPPSYLSQSSSAATPPVVLSSTFTRSSPQAIDALKWALGKGFNVDLDVQANLRDNEGDWEALEEFFSNAIPRGDPVPKGKVILSNILPPPDDFTLPIVKLLTHPTYRDYQSRTAALSLYSNIFIKFIPPIWGAATPPTPAPYQLTTPSTGGITVNSVSSSEPETPITPITHESIEKKEWKRRIKMYIGPSLEAFGYQRVIYGSSPSPSSPARSNAGDWYELARESFAELGIEQDGIDAVFYGNALRVYTSSS